MLRPRTFSKFGTLPATLPTRPRIREYWQGARVAGKVPNFEKDLGRIAEWPNGVPLHIYCIHFSQQTHPMGSWRVDKCPKFFIVLKLVEWHSKMQLGLKNLDLFHLSIHACSRLADLKKEAY